MIKITDDMVKAAYDAHNWHVASKAGYPALESMKWAIEAALAARKPDDAGELVQILRGKMMLEFGIDGLGNEAANTIEELVEALKPFAGDESKITFEHLRNARAVLKSMGVKM